MSTDRPIGRFWQIKKVCRAGDASGEAYRIAGRDLNVPALPGAEVSLDFFRKRYCRWWRRPGERYDSFALITMLPASPVLEASAKIPVAIYSTFGAVETVGAVEGDVAGRGNLHRAASSRIKSVTLNACRHLLLSTLCAVTMTSPPGRPFPRFFKIAGRS